MTTRLSSRFSSRAFRKRPKSSILGSFPEKDRKRSLELARLEFAHAFLVHGGLLQCGLNQLLEASRFGLELVDALFEGGRLLFEPPTIALEGVDPAVFALECDFDLVDALFQRLETLTNLVWQLYSRNSVGVIDIGR
ncbi:hypothetical protein SAMN05444422_11462 [Halobiforma haloterrestris]|uniref:Uncharacterized protein n=1 Tax=Natronobacterium haloterrestre TaxID=148448 RepID=A0A1I1L5T5_NATHA|nr:hypothetical protein [Halobiforma haloterrestris]SFC67892.1 hypothetical protein SAMN05444422_11462 [Halobiforma haloterrestris]